MTDVAGVLGTATGAEDPVETTAEAIRGFVRFFASHPEMMSIAVKESSVESERLEWLVDNHLVAIHAFIGDTWRELADAGIVVALPYEHVSFLFAGLATFPYASAAEFTRVTGRSPYEPDMIEAHAESIVRLLVPGHRR